MIEIEERLNTTLAEDYGFTQETAIVLGQLETLGIIEKLAQSYTDWRAAGVIRSSGTFEEVDKKNTYLEAVTALADLYLARNNPDQLARFREDWGQKAPAFEMYLDHARDAIAEAQTGAYEKVLHMNSLKRNAVIFLAVYKISQYASKKQFPELNQLLGSTRHTSKKIAVSAGLNAASGAAVWALIGAGMSFAEVHPTLPELPNNNALIALAISYILEYGATLVNAKINMNALKDPEVATTPNVLATVAYYYLQKLAPDNKKIRDIGVYMGSFWPTVSGEWTTLPLLAIPHGSSIVFNKNIISALGQLATGAMLTYYQKRQHRNE